MKKRNLAYIIIFVIILAACLWAFISAGIITGKFKKELENNSLGTKEVNIKNLLITETKEDRKFWEIFADEGYYQSTTQIAELSFIIGNFFDEKENVIASLKADKGLYDQNEGRLELNDKIIIVYKDGMNLSCDKLVWHGRGSDIVATGTIRLEMPTGIVVYGEKASLNGDFTDVKIFGQTKTEIYNGNVKL